MEVAIMTCNACTMRIEEGREFKKAGHTYCCEGCAEGTGCTCPDEI